MPGCTPSGTPTTTPPRASRHANDVAELRETSKSHRILSVPEAVERVSAGEMLNLSPLCGGLPPDLAWPYLKRVGEVVLPEAAQANGAVARATGSAVH